MKTHNFVEIVSIRTLLVKFMYLVTLISILRPALAASEELTNVKVIGGFGAECSESSPPNTNFLQPITFNMIDSKKSGSITTAEFEIQFVECAKNKWSKLKSVKTEFTQDITDEIKQNFKEKTVYSKFRVEIKNAKGDTVQTIPFPSSNKGRFTFKVKLNSLDFTKDEETKTKFVDVVLMADRNRQNAADRYFEEVNWGRMRLPLTQPGD
tara:strand:- start:15845 stop:16474 length:630 start_codon:yes stop_codon:yes gene_type:complete